MAVKTSWHRYGTKLRHCHPMYSSSFASFKRNLKTLFFPCLLFDPRLATLPPSDCLHLRFGPPADHARVINAFIVLYCTKICQPNSLIAHIQKRVRGVYPAPAYNTKFCPWKIQPVTYLIYSLHYVWQIATTRSDFAKKTFGDRAAHEELAADPDLQTPRPPTRV